jgi:hypothetical protein
LIPQKDTTVQIEGNIKGTKIEMGIDPGSWVHLMSLMSNIYTDTVRAIIREYAANAVDAHVEAGQKRPIEITLPNDLDATLKVKDYGVGLDEESIRTIYSQYGASTKRETNTQTGSFGIGCKAALAYTNQFSVTANKDGIQTQVLVQRDGEGAGSMTVVGKFPTSEPNGVEVSIPVDRNAQSQFERKARDIFRFFKPGTVLVNGEAPEFIDGLWLEEDMVLLDTGETNIEHDYVVMGNVAYPVEASKARHDYQDGEVKTFEWNLGTRNGQSLVMFVPLGSVQPAPSREGLIYESEATQVALRDMLALFRKRVKGQVQRMIDKENTKPDALKAAIHWHATLPKVARGNEYTFQGAKLPSEIRVGDLEKAGTSRIIVVDGQRADSDAYYRRLYGEKVSKHSREPAVQMEVWPGAMWITGYGDRQFTAPMRKKLDKYIDDNDMTHPKRFFLLPKGLPRDVRQWVDGPVVRYETIKAVKLPRTVNGRKTTGRIAGSYDVYVGKDFKAGVPADNIDTTKPIFWVLAGGHGTAISLMLRRYPDATTVELTGNRVDKFLRNFPQARRLREGVQDAFNAWFANITQRDALAMHLRGPEINWRVQQSFEKLNVARLHDPRLREAARLVQHKQADEYLQIRRNFERVLGTLPEKKRVKKWVNPLDDYPLMDNIGSPHHLRGKVKEHMYIYLNAAYAEKTTTTGGAK